MATLTAHVSEAFIERIDALSERLDRSRAWVIKEAISEYLACREADEKRWEETVAAIEAADRGDVVPAEEVFAWLDTWGNADERIE